MATQDQMPQFNLDEIPNSSLMVLLSIIHQEATEYLKQPGIQEKYNQWLKKGKLINPPQRNLNSHLSCVIFLSVICPLKLWQDISIHKR